MAGPDYYGWTFGRIQAQPCKSCTKRTIGAMVHSDPKTPKVACCPKCRDNKSISKYLDAIVPFAPGKSPTKPSAQLYKCAECDETTTEPLEVRLYKCSNDSCEHIFTQDDGVGKNGTNCPECSRFGSRIGDLACPECNEGPMEQVDSVACDVEGCDRLFEEEDDLRQHQEDDHDMDPCPVCDLMVLDLDVHMREVHDSEKCPHCEDYFIDGDLDGHIDGDHPEESPNMEECGECGRYFHNEEMEDHIKDKHPDLDPEEINQ